MCIIAWNWQPESENPLFVISNRDEFYDRPTQPAHWWCKDGIFAGKDLLAGGTWLGINKYGRFAAITNYRNSDFFSDSQLSRGTIVKEFLISGNSNDFFLNKLLDSSSLYKPFNLLLYDGINFQGFESYHNNVINIKPGFGVLSNNNIYCTWPKSIALLNEFKNQKYNVSNKNFFSILNNNFVYSDEHLPNTGFSIEIERMLSSIFIKSDIYGTRSSTVISIKKSSVYFLENFLGNNSLSYFKLLKI